MPNHPKDRHVAAAAVAIGAATVVTSNIRDFTPLPPGIVAMRPDQFLGEFFGTKRDELFGVLETQVAAYRRPSMSIRELLERLGKIAPEFAREALQAVERGSDTAATRQE